MMLSGAGYYDCFLGAGVSVVVWVADQTVLGFEDHNTLPGILEADRAVGSRGAAAYDADVTGDD